MERLNRIFAEWAKEDKKTELASQKVELGLVDDLNKALENSDSLVNDIKVDNKRILDMEKSINGYLKERSKLVANEDKAADKFFDAEKKLSEAKQKYNEATNVLELNKNAVVKREEEIQKAEKSKAPKAKKAQSLLAVFDKNLQKAEAAAKDLGIKLPIAKYAKAQDNLRKSIS
tara:strand:- start:858 stop:1379 length:522 start_codon:yes stop_codon:yes gene_type:complete